MKTFKEFLSEAAFQNPGFMIPRNAMPQIMDIDGFVEFLDSKNVYYYFEDRMDPHELRPTQLDYDDDKVNSIINSFEQLGSPQTSTPRPVLVSSSDKQNKFVLDGHHRWLASKRANRPINVLVIDLPIAKALALANEFAGR